MLGLHEPARVKAISLILLFHSSNPLLIPRPHPDNSPAPAPDNNRTLNPHLRPHLTLTPNPFLVLIRFLTLPIAAAGVQAKGSLWFRGALTPAQASLETR